MIIKALLQELLPGRGKVIVNHRTPHREVVHLPIREVICLLTREAGISYQDLIRIMTARYQSPSFQGRKISSISLIKMVMAISLKTKPRRVAQAAPREQIRAITRERIRVPALAIQLPAPLLIQVVQEALPEISGVSALLEAALLLVVSKRRTIGMSSPINNNHIIKLEDANKVYTVGSNDVNALNGVNISFECGDFWAIMGPSGSGKSTMMNIIGCLDRLTKGRYFLEGQDVSNLDDDALSEFRLKYLGFIFQSFNLIPQLSVLRNIELPLYYLGWEPEDSIKRAEELALSVGLEERLEHKPTELSGGQMQRVAIARALANDPKILLADEPTGNLDSQTGVQIMELLAKLNDKGKTIIMVTHEQDIAMFAKNRLHMKDGIIDWVGSK
jgi:putative ABC transport system ATP-binding protein